MRRWLVFLLLLVLAPGSHADPVAISPNPSESVVPAAPVTDPAQISRHFHQVLARPEFAENEKADISTRLKEMLSQWFLHLGAQFAEFKYASRMPAVASLLIVILAAISIVSLIAIMVHLTRRRYRRDPDRFDEGSDRKAFPAPEFYDDEIERALRSGFWQVAWLAAWRQFLSRLERRQLVEADRTRTNREYLAQLRGKTIPDPALVLLVAMVEAYDRFIYGRQTIGEPEWIHFSQQMNEAGLLLHLEDKSVAKPGVA